MDLFYIECAMGTWDGVLGYEDREEVDAPIEAGERTPCRLDGPGEPGPELVACESLAVGSDRRDCAPTGEGR
ncbi:MAG: hypothetical protein M3P51_10305 [Chloroflexota bacterium]|nr:hypothetical protein [Chloroflexota bacterium]